MDLEDLRLAVYRAFEHTGQAPTVDELRDKVGCSIEAAEDGLRELATARHVALDEAGRVVMAHPFSAVPLGFSVMGRSTLWWGGCAWDSFALPHLVTSEPDVLVATRCPFCNAAHAWTVGRDAPPPGDQVAHFLIPASRMWDDVVHTCAHQRIFCDEMCVEQWVTRNSYERGYVMDLPTLWRLASGWYCGRLERDYRRREPAEAAEYFRRAGLSGPFWGL